MRERPILFSGAMVRAILDDRKSQTRRVVKPQPDIVTSDGVPARFTPRDAELGRLGEVIRCPYGQPGDRLWVKETIRKTGEFPGGYCTSEYVADNAPTVADAWPWQKRTLSSIHCPRGLSRIALEIAGARVERLQDISAEDSVAEGLREDEIRGWYSDDVPGSWASPVAAYRELWESINGPGSWDTNPFVWVIEFKRVTP